MSSCGATNANAQAWVDAAVTRAERHRLMAQCHAQLAELLRAEAAELDTPTATPRKARRVAPPEPATARGIAIARQAIEAHTRARK